MKAKSRRIFSVCSQHTVKYQVVGQHWNVRCVETLSYTRHSRIQEDCLYSPVRVEKKNPSSRVIKEVARWRSKYAQLGLYRKRHNEHEVGELPYPPAAISASAPVSGVLRLCQCTSLASGLFTRVIDWLNQSLWIKLIFTARCTILQSAVLRLHVDCPSVRLFVCGSGSHKLEILETSCTEN